MKTITLSISLLLIILNAQNLRNNNTHLKIWAETHKTIHYIDDDVDLTDSSQEEQSLKQDQNNTQLESPQDSEEVLIVNTQEQEELDKEEQQEYEEEQKKLIINDPADDDGNYLSFQDNNDNNNDKDQKEVVQEEQSNNDDMPEDVIQQDLHPIEIKDPLPDQQTETPYAGEDDSFLLGNSDNEDDVDYKVEPAQKMDGELTEEDAARVYAAVQQEEQQQMLREMELGPHTF